jgi:hypothetical protein
VAGIVKNVVFWDVTPCDSYENRRFGGMYHPDFRARGISELGKLTVTSNSAATGYC